MTKTNKFSAIDDPIALLTVAKKMAREFEALLGSTFGERERRNGTVELELSQFSRYCTDDKVDMTLKVRGGSTHLRYDVSEGELLGTKK